MSAEPTIKLPKFRSQYLNDYMEMVEDTESPRLFHVWSALYALGAAMGRRCWLPTGVGNIYGNQYILLVGAPATKKSTSIGFVKRLLNNGTQVRIAPNDTAGHRQGLVRAMHQEAPSEESIAEMSKALGDVGLAGLTDEQILSSEKIDTVQAEDKHHMAVLASEFTGFIGQSNKEMLDFLTQMWDGEDYQYMTKGGEVIMNNPLLAVLGGTTPTSIASAMPATAGGQGFLSRMILVYGSQKYKSIPWPTFPPLELVGKVESVISHVYHQFNGAFSQTEEAKQYAASLYEYDIDVNDSRFVHYADRRFIHLIKTAMAVAASRKSTTIQVDDYKDAHSILRATEKGMPDALGQFGLSPHAQVKQGIVEFLKHHGAAVDMAVIKTIFQRDVRNLNELTEIVNDLLVTKQIVGQGTQGTGSFKLMAKVNRSQIEDEMMNALAEA